VTALRRLALTLTVAGLLPLAPAAAADVSAVKVVVNTGVPGKTIAKSLVADIFLRRSAKWSDGTIIQPVDQISSAPARLVFNRSILGFSALDVQQYWVGQIARGKVPPPVKKTEEEVIAFVAENPGAIGYVAEGTALPPTVRVLPVE
jgi:ABC-type phosphate transport system substrate-binding protein